MERERTGGTWRLTKVEEPQRAGTTSYAYTSDGLVSWIFAPSPAGVACNTTIQQPGCRALNLIYTSVNGQERLASVDLVIYDPKPDSHGRPSASAGMARVTVARYEYDSAGMLTASWDPRLHDGMQPLKTTYTYRQSGPDTQLATLTPPGEDSWTFRYEPTGRITGAERPRPDGSGTSLWTVRYDVPTSETGLPQLTSDATAAWGQNEDDAPLAGAAVWTPDRVPAASPSNDDYTYASLYYFTAEGRTTNLAGYGAGAWQVDSFWYDAQGNVTRMLTAGNRGLAMADPAEKLRWPKSYRP